MMLVQLPAMDAVSVSVHVPWPSLPPSLAVAARTLARPSFWLVLLATLVILSSIRAALLYVRPRTHKASVSLVAPTSEKPAPSIPCPPSPAPVPSSSAAASSTKAPSATPAQRPTTSWLWGLVKWDSLPALPVSRGRGWAQLQMGMQQGVGVAQQQQMQQIQQQQQRGRRGPAFDHPLPALYENGPPVSMAKMIMSRHTFRRPSSRPPPVRSANTVQYQRRSPSMV